MSGRAAIVTLTVGEEHSRRWRSLCEENWREYAERHGFDVIAIDRPLDESERAASRSPSWQKLLVLEQPFAADYERIVWVDADFVFGRDAPDVTEGVPAASVGAVDELATPTEAVRRLIHRESPQDYYRAAGLPGGCEEVVQGGLLVLSPEHHREVVRHVYDAYEDPGPGLNYEMRPLSYELITGNQVHWLDPRFNTLWDVRIAHREPHLVEHPGHPGGPAAARRALDEVFGLHFAGRAEQMDDLLGDQTERPAAPAARPAESAVVMLVFARPDTTARVLDVVRQVRPRRLFVVADAPHPGDADEAARCEATRALFETVDWDCDLRTDFAESRTTMNRRIESGLDWVFDEVDEAIVLEDDTIPDPSFFPFCDELLERYRDDERVLTVAGNNFQFGGPASGDSYYFSRYPHIWGWATWRRAWEQYDPALSAWPKLRDDRWLEDLFDDPHAVAYWGHLFDRAAEDRDAWDRKLVFASWVAGGVHAIPNVNLVTNVGFREDGTHTGPEHRGLINDVPIEPVEFPLRHPRRVEANAGADAYSERVLYGGAIGKLFERLRATIRAQEPSSR